MDEWRNIKKSQTDDVDEKMVHFKKEIIGCMGNA